MNFLNNNQNLNCNSLNSKPVAKQKTGFRIKKAANIASGSAEPNRKKVASVPKSKVREIADIKMKDLNAASIEAAMRMVEGTARSMGIDIVEG